MNRERKENRTMKKAIKFLPLLLGLILLIYSFYAHHKISGFRIFDIDTSTGLFYVRTYKYAALGGAVIISAYAAILIVKYMRKSGKKKLNN